MLISLFGTEVPGNEGSWERKFHNSYNLYGCELHFHCMPGDVQYSSLKLALFHCVYV